MAETSKEALSLAVEIAHAKEHLRRLEERWHQQYGAILDGTVGVAPHISTAPTPFVAQRTPAVPKGTTDKPSKLIGAVLKASPHRLFGAEELAEATGLPVKIVRGALLRMAKSPTGEAARAKRGKYQYRPPRKAGAGGRLGLANHLAVPPGQTEEVPT